MHDNYWKLKAHQFRAERDILAHDKLFWKGCTILLAVGFVGLSVNYAIF